MELYHYNHNHDPRTGKFTTSSGGARSYSRAIRKSEKGRVKAAAKYMRAKRFNSSSIEKRRSKMNEYKSQTEFLIKDAMKKGYTVTSKDVIKSGQKGVDVSMFIIGGIPLYAVYGVGTYMVYDDANPAMIQTRRGVRTVKQNPMRVASKKYKVRK